MDEGFNKAAAAAQSGNIDALYTLIKDDPNVFERMDETKFMHTPLHIAAASGQSGFAMEMMNLKPSFARKLNQDGWSPIHLAYLNQQYDMVIDLLSVDKDLIRVKGREGFTVLHHAARDGDVDVLSRILNMDLSPDFIFDLSFRRQTALHIAAENNRFEALEAMLAFLRKAFKDKRSQRSKILNLEDKDGNSVLHLAASINQPQMIKLLLLFTEVKKNKTNQRGFTAMDILQRQTQVDNTESVNILNGNTPWSRKYSESRNLLEDQIREMKPETIGALLVVFALVLTMTYQAILSPPGGIYQAEAGGSNVSAAAGGSNDHGGKAVINSLTFLLFYIPNGLAFILSWVITIWLLVSTVPKSIMSFLGPLYGSMCFCYGAGTTIIAPSYLVSSIATGSIIIYFIAIVLHIRLRSLRKYSNEDV